MMVGRAAFKPKDLESAIRAALAAGLPAGTFAVEVRAREGSVRVLPAIPQVLQGDDLDDELTQWRSKQRGHG